MQKEALKQKAAEAALKYVEYNAVLGVGTGSTINYFIDALATIKNRIKAAVSSSDATTARLKKIGIPVVDLNSVNSLPVYVDGADEFNNHKYLIKGGGAALTREKIVAEVAKKFVCIVDHSKKVDVLGRFPIPIEVIPMARSYIARKIVKMNGEPVYREGVVTDNGNVIIDVHQWHLLNPIETEQALNNLPGVVTNGIFAQRRADIILCAQNNRIDIIE
ncbi:MAG: ribose 5-phosphate isomerase A [Coxiella sp. RIFCSPHIGHO2_12_FULL_42_15]|nr:MAG: ribose 5-phosphate isomerase A [Coxiella sp. RIFCSPHIGHO2_12_FULL_42_15]